MGLLATHINRNVRHGLDIIWQINSPTVSRLFGPRLDVRNMVWSAQAEA